MCGLLFYIILGNAIFLPIGKSDMFAHKRDIFCLQQNAIYAHFVRMRKGRYKSPRTPQGISHPKDISLPIGNIANPARDLYRKRCPEGHLSFYIFIVSEIRPFFLSTDRTFTCTLSPTESTWLGCLMNLSEISEICTRPS